MRPPIRVHVGEELPATVRGPITQTDIVRFAGAGGDFNPLHHDPAAAREAGFESVIAMGQFQAGVLAGWVSDRFGVEHLRQFSVRFTAPVRVGDALELTGRVVSTRTEQADTVAELEMAVTVGDLTVVSGRAVVRVESEVSSI